jgi:hypothetical protein
MADQVSIPLSEARSEAPKPDANQEWRNTDEVKRIIAQRDEFKKQATDLAAYKAANEAEQAARDAEKTARRDAEEQKRMIEQGKYEELLKRKDDAHKTEIAERDKKYATKMVPFFIQAAASQLPNLAPEARKDLALLLRDDIRPDSDGNPVVYRDGRPAVDADGKPYDPTQYVIDAAKSRPHMLLDSMPKSHGAGATGTAAAGGSNKRDMGALMEAKDNAALEKWASTDPEGYRAAARDYASSMVKAATQRKPK